MFKQFSCFVSVYLLFTPLVSAFSVPPNDGFVTDAAGILTVEQETSLESELKAYEDQTSNEIAVLVVRSLEGEPIADTSFEVGRSWGIGQKGKDNGILLLVSYEDRELFMATGYGLEGAVPDVVAQGIIDQEIIPRFRDGNYYDGIIAGIDALKKHIGGEYTADRYSSGREGGFFDEFFSFWVFFLFLIMLDFFVSFLGRSKSWWLGGVFGTVAGIIFALIFAKWLLVPVLTAIGFLFDYLVSRHYGKIKRWRGHRGGWGGGGFSRGSMGGGGSFGGGSFGGGGAGGRW